MEDYVITDALTGDTVAFDYTTGDAYLKCSGQPQTSCTALFFPGCSFINYAMPLVSAVYDTLTTQGLVDGISVLCCGRILSYEPNGDVLRDTLEQQLRDRLAQMHVSRIVTACPNCLKALREAFAFDERVSSIEIVPLSRVLADYGYRIDRNKAAALILGDPEAPLLLCAHDSCPDRDTGEFADGLRDLMPEGLLGDPVHCRARSLCCGSLPRAAGKFEAADELARRNGQEALDIGAHAIVTACMSCVFQLTMAQNAVPAVHYLELLYEWRIDWSSVGGWMKLRFLFDDMLGVIDAKESGRAFKGLGGN